MMTSSAPMVAAFRAGSTHLGWWVTSCCWGAPTGCCLAFARRFTDAFTSGWFISLFWRTTDDRNWNWTAACCKLGQPLFARGSSGTGKPAGIGTDEIYSVFGGAPIFLCSLSLFCSLAAQRKSPPRRVLGFFFLVFVTTALSLPAVFFLSHRDRAAQENFHRAQFSPRNNRTFRPLRVLIQKPGSHFIRVKLFSLRKRPLLHHFFAFFAIFRGQVFFLLLAFLLGRPTAAAAAAKQKKTFGFHTHFFFTFCFFPWQLFPHSNQKITEATSFFHRTLLRGATPRGKFSNC